MLTKMWMGLYLSLVQVVFYIIVVINHDSKYWLQHSSVACVLNNIILLRYDGRFVLNRRFGCYFYMTPVKVQKPSDNTPVVHHPLAP